MYLCRINWGLKKIEASSSLEYYSMKRLNSSETVTLEWVSMNELKIELSLTSEFYIERPLFSD